MADASWMRHREREYGRVWLMAVDASHSVHTVVNHVHTVVRYVGS